MQGNAGLELPTTSARTLMQLTDGHLEEGGSVSFLPLLGSEVEVDDFVKRAAALTKEIEAYFRDEVLGCRA